MDRTANFCREIGFRMTRFGVWSRAALILNAAKWALMAAHNESIECKIFAMYRFYLNWEASVNDDIKKLRCFAVSNLSYKSYIFIPPSDKTALSSQQEF
jgi:hypothetical protein